MNNICGRLFICGVEKRLTRQLAISSCLAKQPMAPPPFEITARPDDQLTFDKTTHTGQAWDQDDYRSIRFARSPKQVNPNFAVNLIAKVPPLACSERVVSCDGGGGALGHPKIYINLDIPGNHACGYCGLRFYREGQAHDGHDHIQV